MSTLFTISKKGGNNGALWNGAHPEKFFPIMRREGVRAIWDVRRTPNGQYGSFFDTDILKWCCNQVSIDFKWRLDLAPAREVFTACNSNHWDLFAYAKAYFTPQVIAVLNQIKEEELDGTAILCAEQELFNCHRLLIAEYLHARFPQIKIRHLGLAYDREGNEKDGVPRQIMHNTCVYIQQLLTN